jgi:glycosyltransferase involved in cell wall biosynthesis
VPVIITEKVGDFSDLAKNENLGLIIDSINIEKEIAGHSNNSLITEVLSNFVHNIKLNREDWAKRCISAAKENLDWEVHAKKIFEMYKELSK